MIGPEDEDPAAQAPTFVLRPRPGAPATTLTLGPEHLLLDAPMARHAYRDIAGVTLLVDPNRKRRGRYRARIDMANGDGIELVDSGYDAAGREVDMAAPYSAFVRALAGRVAAANPAARFRAAARPLDHGFNLVTGGVTGLVMAGGALVLLLAGYYAVGGILAGFTGIFAPFVVNYLRATRPVAFDPNAIPPGLLPAAAPIQVA